MASPPMIIPALLALVSLVAVGCGGAPPDDSSAPVFALDRNVADGIAAVDETRTNVLAADMLRLTLQDLLSEHVTASIEAMRLAIDEDDLEATIDALTANTDGLTGAIGLVYGPDGAHAFDQLWTNHIEFFNRYAAAARDGDTTEKATVLAELDHYESDFSSYIEVATAGELQLHVVLHVLHGHVEQLIDQADAWAAGDFALSFEKSTEAYRHVDVIARALAIGISTQDPAAFPGSVDTPAQETCAAARVAAGHVASTAADVGRSQLSASADIVVAATDHHQRAIDALAEVGLEQASVDEVVAAASALTTLDDPSSIPAERAAALSQVRAVVDESIC